MLEYSDFIKLVPPETKNFVDLLLRLLDSYSDKNLIFKDISNGYTTNYYSKTFHLMCYAIAHIPRYESFLSRYRFKKEQVLVEEISNKKSEELFKKFDVVPRYDDITKYMTLTPLDMLIPKGKDYYRYCSQEIFDELFPKANGFNSFLTDVNKYNESIKLESNRLLEQDIYGSLPITVISYLETASKIRTLLFEEENTKRQDIWEKSEDDITPLSLVLAAYFYKDVSIYKEENIGEKTSIKNIFSSKGIRLDKIWNNIGLEIVSNDIARVEKNPAAIKYIYQRYCTEGCCQKIVQSQISVSKILENVFNREFTNSTTVERLLAKMDCHISAFNNLEDQVKESIKAEKANYSFKLTEEFYNNLPKEICNFADFTVKIYTLLLEKMKDNKHNSKLLSTEDDATTLALLIATYYFKGDVSEFLIDYGITLEKILNLLNISITKEEIEATQLDQKTLVNRYKRFFYDGVNRDKSSKTLTINDIAHNLCDRFFNHSMIVESIFLELNGKENLETNFLKIMNIHFTIKEDIRKMELAQRLFKNIPIETIKVLKDTSKIHNYLKSNLKGWPEEDIKSVSLLLALLSSNNSEVKKYLEYLGFNKSTICKYLKITVDEKILSGEEDIDLLSKEYGSYIFGGKNKGKNREDLTVMELVKNVFSKEINNSVILSEFLAYFHQTYESYENFEENYRSYIEKTKEDEKNKRAKEFIFSYSSTQSYLTKVASIYEVISKQFDSLYLNPTLIKDENDIKELSMIIALYFYESSSKKFFKKHNITFERILESCNLDKILFDELKRYEDIKYINFAKFKEAFSNYFEKDADIYRRRKTIDDFIKRMFDASINSSKFLENLISKLGANYDILKKEVESGKDYELSLTIDDRIELLTSSPTDSLDLNDVKSVLHFGESLSSHSKYIHDELPKLMLSDVHQTSIDTINGIINKVYEEEPKEEKSKKSLFSRLFAISVEDEKPTYVLNPSAINDLKAAIDANISVLSKELIGYDSIRKYMEAYRKKNRSHLMVSTEAANKIKQKLATLDPHKEDEYSDFLTVNSQLQIINDKSNRFATTNHLMQQELLKVNQAIVNHFITINALEMARDDLLPLIGSELAIGQGRSTENSSLELSQNVVHLLQSLLDRNVEGATQNIEQLRSSNISSDIFESLNKDIEIYLQGLNQVRHIEEEINHLNVKDSDEETTPISLTTSKEIPSQKTLGTIYKKYQI